MSIAAIVERALALYRDASFAPVRAWKEDVPGRRAVGFLPIYAPREIIHAAGMLPVAVVGNGEIEIIRGDAYFQSYICHLPRSVIELGVTGRLDALDGMIFPATCDVIRNLSGMWKLLFPDRYAKYLDLPQNFAWALGGRFYLRELRTLCGDLMRLSGVDVTDERLRESIRVFNRNRALVASLDAARAAKPWLYPTSELFLLVRAGNTLPVEEHNQMLASYLEAATHRSGEWRDNARVVVSGAFCEQPPLELIQTLERAGCYVVHDDFLLGYRALVGEVSTTGDPLEALARAYVEGSAPSACRYNPGIEGQDPVVAAVAARHANGVIFCAPSFCDPALLDQPMRAAALERAGIPYTSLKYAENSGQFQEIREQAGTFSDSIRLWSAA